MLVVLVAVISFGIASPVYAESTGSFNEQSYSKVTSLSAAIEAFRKISADGELSVLAAHTTTIHEKAADLTAYNIAAEAPNDIMYESAANNLKVAATKLETVSKKMTEAAQADDDSLFVSYQKEYNNSVTAFNDAIKTYAAATEKTAERIRFEQIAVIGLAVLTGIVAIAVWFWASVDDMGHKMRARARRWVALVSLLPFAGALAALALYVAQLVNGYVVWLPTAGGVLILLIMWVVYLVRQRRLAGIRAM